VAFVGPQLPRDGKLARTTAGLVLDLGEKARARRTLDASFPVRANGALHVAKRAEPGVSLEVVPRNVAALEGKIDGPLVTYEDVAPALDLVYAAAGTGVEELRVARTREAARVARWTVKLGPALAGLRVREGYVEAVDEKGVVKLVASPMFAVDAAGVRREPSVSVTRGAEGFELEARLDADSLVPPIVIDPAWTTVPSMKAARIRAWNARVDGKVVVGGGIDGAGSPVLTVEAYDPSTNTWSDAGTCKWANPGGSGGTYKSAVATIAPKKAQIFDYYLRCIYDADTAAKTTSGGGIYPDTFSEGAFAYAPAANKFVGYDGLGQIFRFIPGSISDTGSPIAIPAYPCYPQTGATAIAVQDTIGSLTTKTERVWVVGGIVNALPHKWITRFDPSAGTCSYPPLGLAFSHERPSVVQDGSKVFIVGGAGEDPTAVEMFDLAEPIIGYAGAVTFNSKIMSPAPQPLVFPFTFAKVTDGTKGYYLAVRREHVMAFDPSGATRWHEFPNVESPRVETIGSALDDGRALIAGGFVSGVGVVSTAEIFEYPKVDSACAIDSECGFDRLCIDGKCCEGCAAKKNLGEACTADAQCGSGHCVDSVCCNNACTSQCAACDVEGAKGTCTPIIGDPRGGRTACAGAGTPCAGKCDGVYVLTCGYPGPAESCGATCSEGRAVPSACDGKGACKVSTPIPCGSYACTDGACKSSCTTDADCTTGYRCQGSSCVPATVGTCSEDLATATSLDGRSRACAPFRCDPSLGACREICNTSDDCLAGNVCAETKACVAPAPEPANQGGCSYGARGPYGSFALLGLAAFALRRRRPRGRACEPTVERR
jgi:hypothetical protein